MTARDLRRAVAAEFQRLDAHQFGYDHGFCADPDSDPETAAFVDAAIRIVLGAAVAVVDNDDTCRCGGCDTCLPRKLAAQLRRLADATTPTSKEQCGHCNGSGIDPEHSSPGCTDPDRGVEPPTLEPCIACQYPKEQ